MMGTLKDKYGAASQAIAATGQGIRKSAHIPAAATAALSYQRDKEKERADTAEARIAELEAEGAKKGARSLPIDAIDDSPYQPRMVYIQEALAELAATIKAAGQLEPVKVRQKDDGRFELVSGHRRLRAIRDLIGGREIDAYLVDLSDEDAERATMLANEARENLTDYERAKLYQLAIDRGLATNQTECAAYFGTSQSKVSRCLSMLSLPEDELAKLEDNPASMNAQQAVKLLKALNGPKRAVASKEQEIKKEILSAEEKPLYTVTRVGNQISVTVEDKTIDAEWLHEAITTVLSNPEYGWKVFLPDRKKGK